MYYIEHTKHHLKENRMKASEDLLCCVLVTRRKVTATSLAFT